MGSFIELNDTLLISVNQGFPASIFDLENHRKQPVTLEEVNGKVFSFKHKKGARLFHLDPVRVFLVQKIGEKWLFWGKAVVLSQTISQVRDKENKWINDEWETSGTFRFTDIYEPRYQELVTGRESPEGKNFFS